MLPTKITRAISWQSARAVEVACLECEIEKWCRLAGYDAEAFKALAKERAKTSLGTYPNIAGVMLLDIQAGKKLKGLECSK